MALDKGTRNLLIAGGIMALGGLAYWYFTRKSGKEHGFVWGLSNINGDGTKFSIYVKQGVTRKELADGVERYIANGLENSGVKGYPDYNKFEVGDKIKITNGGKLNGTYDITKKWYWNEDPTKTKLLFLDLKNNNWGGWNSMKEDTITTKSGNYKLYKKAKDYPRWELIKKTK